MFRLTVDETDPRRLRVEGRLIAATVAEFTRVAHAAMRAEESWSRGRPPATPTEEVGEAGFHQDPNTLGLDLAGVTFIDQAGVAAVRELLGKGALLGDCSPFVRVMLAEPHR